MAKHSWLTISVAAFILSVSGFAADSASSNAANNFRSACQSDINQFCKDITPGQGRVAACLHSHSDKLSSSCQSARNQMMSQWQAKAKAFHSACGDDVQKFCKNEMGFAAVNSCLNSHGSNLSATCSDFRASNPMQPSSTG